MLCNIVSTIWSFDSLSSSSLLSILRESFFLHFFHRESSVWHILPYFLSDLSVFFDKFLYCSRAQESSFCIVVLHCKIIVRLMPFLRIFFFWDYPVQIELKWSSRLVGNYCIFMFRSLVRGNHTVITLSSILSQWCLNPHFELQTLVHLKLEWSNYVFTSTLPVIYFSCLAFWPPRCFSV